LVLRFHPIKPRDNWRQQWKALGYHLDLREESKALGYSVDMVEELIALGCSLDPLENYWVEDIEQPFCATFEKSEMEETLIPATNELNDMVLGMVDYVCSSPRSDQLLEQLRIPEFFRNAVRKSWQRKDTSIYGRFDLAYDGQSLKLLEINYDSPIMLVETAVLQDVWYKDLKHAGIISENTTQFNCVCENLKQCFANNCRSGQIAHFSSFYALEDKQTILFLKSLADALGLKTSFSRADEFSLDPEGNLVDADIRIVTQLFKLYPWEILLQEDKSLNEKLGKFFLTELVESGRVVFWEPAWKFIASSKAALALLWEMSPNHKWLLETYVDDGSAKSITLQAEAHVRKPLFGRGGVNVSVVIPDHPEHSESVPGDLGGEGFVVQKYQPLISYQDHYAVLGSWVINGKPSGIGIRADRSRITGMKTLFIPHYVIDDPRDHASS
jgi:glutathionylspermidine synthase